ncbi:unnamed protein product [Ilex paraguariensis]|uniref:PB1 domain-containing protein n=1 Tax=Ilex paraguariensis TaxID=185542 RepID=A0ABC8R5W0_9AQUA
MNRVGDDIDRNNLPQILYEDEDHDKVVLASDGDLAAAVDHARSVGWKGLKLHLDYSGTPSCRRGSGSGGTNRLQIRANLKYSVEASSSSPSPPTK